MLDLKTRLKIQTLEAVARRMGSFLNCESPDLVSQDGLSAFGAYDTDHFLFYVYFLNDIAHPRYARGANK